MTHASTLRLTRSWGAVDVTSEGGYAPQRLPVWCREADNMDAMEEEFEEQQSGRLCYR